MPVIGTKTYRFDSQAAMLPVDIFINYYELLHVQPTAPAPVIKASYQAMMQKLNHHPDRGGNVAFAQQLNEAVKTLCNPELRARYDVHLNARMASGHTRGAEKPRHKDGKPASNQEWGDPGGSPQHPDSNQSDVDSESAGSDKRTRSEHSENANGAAGRQTQNAAWANPEQSCSILQPLGAYCLFCKARLIESDNKYRKGGNYSSIDSARCQRCNGASTPITLLPASSNAELRKLYRLEHSADAVIHTHWSEKKYFASRLYDFSPFGCSCLSMQVLPIDHVLMIDTAMFNAICRVRNIRKTEYSSYLIGLEFLTLDIQSAPGALLNAFA